MVPNREFRPKLCDRFVYVSRILVGWDHGVMNKDVDMAVEQRLLAELETQAEE